ncbi:MAG: hypothetical protein HY332_24390 [Chloroflexi bacterium]|nr:hypothetical protein [Chloroflexota bacterium]
MTTKLRVWERGLAVDVPDQPGMTMYLWFYEWNMFGAFRAGEHTSGRRDFPKETDADRSAGRITSPDLRLEMNAEPDGARLRLTAINATERAWPTVAGIIPCFAPGDFGVPEPRPNARFVDDGHTRTYYLGRDGLALLQQREIHLNCALRSEVDRHARGGRFVWSEKWPTSDRDAVGGLIVRESVNGDWVTAIAWERYLSAQGHNPWKCMHLAIQLGPLRPAETITVRGRIYLFRGSKEECLHRYREEFGDYV